MKHPNETVEVNAKLWKDAQQALQEKLAQPLAEQLSKILMARLACTPYKEWPDFARSAFQAAKNEFPLSAGHYLASLPVPQPPHVSSENKPMSFTPPRVGQVVQGRGFCIQVAEHPQYPGIHYALFWRSRAFGSGVWDVVGYSSHHPRGTQHDSYYSLDAAHSAFRLLTETSPDV